jgi:hypothetical protein
VLRTSSSQRIPARVSGSHVFLGHEALPSIKADFALARGSTRLRQEAETCRYGHALVLGFGVLGFGVLNGNEQRDGEAPEKRRRAQHIDRLSLSVLGDGRRGGRAMRVLVVRADVLLQCWLSETVLRGARGPVCTVWYLWLCVLIQCSV